MTSATAGVSPDKGASWQEDNLLADERRVQPYQTPTDPLGSHS